MDCHQHSRSSSVNLFMRTPWKTNSELSSAQSCHLQYNPFVRTPRKTSSGLSSAQSVIFGTIISCVPHGRRTADCHQHSLSSSEQSFCAYPMEDEQRTVISTVCHLRNNHFVHTPRKMSSGLSSALCHLRYNHFMCTPWKMSN